MRAAFGRVTGAWTWHTRRKGTFRRKASGGSGTGGSGGGGGGGGGGDSGAQGPGGKGMGAFTLATVAWKKYLHVLETHPVTTKAVTTGALNGIGDLLSQCVFEKNSTIDINRATRFTLLGLLFVGPALHSWYQVLNRLVPSPQMRGTLARLALDQFAFAPVFISSIFTILLTAEGRPQEVPGKLKQDFKETLVTNWKVWIPFQFLNFKLVPLHLQVAGANAIALFWNVYISYTAHKELDPKMI